MFGLKPTWWVIILAITIMGVLAGMKIVPVDQFVEFAQWGIGAGAVKSAVVEGAIALKGNG